jgi:glycerate 2-kinase
MVRVENKKKLINKSRTESLRKARALILDGYEAALSAVEPAQLVKSRISITDNTLNVDDITYNLAKFKKIYVVGGGKAGASMVVGLEEVMGNWITGGIVNVPKGKIPKTEKITLNQASHPLPDQVGVEGTQQMLEIAKQATEDDLIICLISGGGSSLMPLPRAKISLEDKQEITGTLLRSGAAIGEVNTVRKHLSSFKGGFLAKEAYPATVLNLIISDVVGDALGDIASGPTVPDYTTFNDAIGVLKKYSLWEKAPVSVRTLLIQGKLGNVAETPKPNEAFFEKVHSSIIGNNRIACLAISRFFESQGIKPYLLEKPIEGEARQVGGDLAAKIREAASSCDSIKKPICFVAGGETTVTVKGKGVGGRNQELSLATAIMLKGFKGFVFASLSTDGLDGPTNAAGAISDGDTLDHAMSLGLNPELFLSSNDTYTFFSKLDDLVITGKTGTNVNDIAVMLVCNEWL